MFLESKNLIVLPFCGESDWQKLAHWFYDEDYKNFFRHQATVYTEEQFKNYNKVVGAQVFVARAKDKKNEIVGLVQLFPDAKTNRAFYAGMLIDKAHQGRRYPLELCVLMGNLCFNKLGYRKCIVEILESHESLKKILEQMGALYEGKHVGECFMEGKFVNELRFCMFDNYFNKNLKPLLEK